MNDKVHLLLAQALIMISIIMDITMDEKTMTLAEEAEEKIKQVKELIG